MLATNDIIKNLREKRGLTQQQLADLIGAKTYTTITKWESGDNFPKGRDIVKLCEIFKVSSDYLLGLIDEDDTIYNFDYPYYPVSIAAGLPVGIDSIKEDDVQYITMPNAVMGKLSGSDNIFLMRINGESMNQTIPDHSLIAVKHTELSLLRNGDIVVYSNDHEYSVKQFFDDKVNRRLIFRPQSNDSRFVDYIVDYDSSDKLRIHGKVVLYIVELAN